MSPTETALVRKFEERTLQVTVLEPGELSGFAVELVHVPDGGWVSNELASDATKDVTDSAATLRAAGRVNGYGLTMDGFRADHEVILGSAVELYRDAAGAHDGLERWAADALAGRSSPKQTIEFSPTGQRRSIDGLGDEAVVMSLEDAPGTWATLVLLRREQLLGTVFIAGGSKDEVAAVALARLLDVRMQRALAGTLRADPVPIPVAFTPKLSLPRPLTLMSERARPTYDRSCPGTGRRVCVMTLGETLSTDTEEIVRAIRSYGVPVQTVSPFSLDGVGRLVPDLADYSRNRLSSDIARFIWDAVPSMSRSPEVTLIVLSGYDFYDPGRPKLNYFYLASAERVAVISNARFDDERWGLPPNPQALRARTIRLVTREVGRLHFGLPVDEGVGGAFGVMQTFPAPWLVDRFDLALPDAASWPAARR